MTEAEGLRLHLSSSSSSGYKGVCRKSSGRFQAAVQRVAGGRPVVLGSFDTAVEAAVAYARAAGEAPTPLCGANRPDMQIDVDVVDGFEFRSQATRETGCEPEPSHRVARAKALSPSRASPEAASEFAADTDAAADAAFASRTARGVIVYERGSGWRTYDGGSPQGSGPLEDAEGSEEAMRGSEGEAEAAVEQAASVQCGESDDTHVASHLQGLPAGEGEATVEAEEEAPVAEAKGRGEGASQDGDESEVEVESTVGKAPPAGSEANPSYARAVGQAEPEEAAAATVAAQPSEEAGEEAAEGAAAPEEAVGDAAREAQKEAKRAEQAAAKEEKAAAKKTRRKEVEPKEAPSTSRALNKPPHPPPLPLPHLAPHTPQIAPAPHDPRHSSCWLHWPRLSPEITRDRPRTG